jgi:hypothetical protein
MEDALPKARAMVDDQEDSLDSFLKSFVKEWDVSSDGLTITTKPIKHELFYDGEVDHHYVRIEGVRAKEYGFPMNRRTAKYDIGGAIIFLPMNCLIPVIRFENQDFEHGHITDGRINCWNKYKNIQTTVLRDGPIAAISTMYGFCKYSRYGSYLRSNQPEPANV